MTLHNKNDRAAWLQGPLAACSALPKRVEIPFRLVLLGAPGVGKGTQALLLSQRLGACHLSTGDVFRAAGSRCERDQTPGMKAAIEYMRRGALVPDSTVWGIVRERSGCLHCQGGFILDGFPRTLSQAVELKELMEGEKLPLNAAVNYELALDEIVSRLSGRRTCRDCKSVFHITGQPPKTEGVCDRCSGRLYQREDDQPESIKVRMDAYRRATMPLIEFYADLGLLATVAAAGSPETILDRTIAALQTLKD
jgi:adenylate kinase